jgi:CRISPR system Cascade subunit CasE
MFLTRMQLNPQRRGTQKLLASPQAMHAAVLAGFADSRRSDAGRILWRADTHARHRVLLFISSPERPDLSHLVEQAGWPTTEAWDTRSYDGLLNSLRQGQRWQFRLTANPVRSGRRAGWADTKPLGHVTAAQQEQWLLDRTAKLGVRIPASAIDGETPDVTVVQRTVRRFGRNGSRVTLAIATFEGHLIVESAPDLKQALTFGGGRAKSYGCGLLTLARPRTTLLP